MLTPSDIQKLKKTFATKKDLEKFATKDDLKKLKGKIEEKIDQRYSDIFDLVDSLAGEIRDERDFRDIATEWKRDHEQRIETLEKTVLTNIQPIV